MHIIDLPVPWWEQQRQEAKREDPPKRRAVIDKIAAEFGGCAVIHYRNPPQSKR